MWKGEKDNKEQFSQGTLSHHYSCHSQDISLPRTLKFTLSRVDPMQRKTLYHSLPGCATILVHLCILFHSKAQWTDSSHSEICWDYADCFGEAIEFKRVPPLIKQLWDQSQLFFCLPLGRQTFQITCTPDDFQVSFFQITIFHAWG